MYRSLASIKFHRLWTSESDVGVFEPGTHAWLTRQSGALPMRHVPSLYIVASELNDPICHSDECQIGSFSSEYISHLRGVWCYRDEAVRRSANAARPSLYIVASELNDPICHSDECQIGSFSSEYISHLRGVWCYRDEAVRRSANAPRPPFLYVQMFISPLRGVWCYRAADTGTWRWRDVGLLLGHSPRVAYILKQIRAFFVYYP